MAKLVTHLEDDCSSCDGTGVVYESRAPYGWEMLNCDCPCHDETFARADEAAKASQAPKASDSTTITTDHPNTRQRLLAQYQTWLDAGKPEYIDYLARPFSAIVRYHFGYFAGSSWQTYRTSIRGVDSIGDQLRCDWTMQPRKSGKPGAIKGQRPDSRVCADAFAAWLDAGKPDEFVYLCG